MQDADRNLGFIPGAVNRSATSFSGFRALYSGNSRWIVSKIVGSKSAAKQFYDGTTKLQRVQFLERALLDPRYAKFLLEQVKPIP